MNHAKMKTIGLIGGMSWESTAIYYRRVNELARARLGGLHSASLVMRSFDFAEIEAMQALGDWDRATDAMAGAARAIAAAGADCVVICTNTMHRMAEEVAAAVDVPLLHIADATGEGLVRAGARRPLLLATRYTMEGAFYVGRLRERFGLDVRVPDDAGRTVVHNVIYDELCRGVVRDESRRAYLDVIAATDCDAVIFGCTEIGMLLDPDALDRPAFDTTELHVRAAIDFALGES